MKTIFYSLTLFASLLLAFTGCGEDNELKNLKVTPVKTLYEPADNKSVVLQNSASATLYFEWEHAKAEDGGMVLYEVVFDKEGGDFSKPIYRVPSDNNGVYNYANISHKQLNKIAGFAGIEPGETGKIIWTVFSSKGINEVKAEEFRILEITRLMGFSDIPASVYITGEGSEGGSDLSNASIMKSIGNGEFEIYTKLTANKPHYFTDAKVGTPRQFYVENNIIKEGPSTGTVTKTGVYRINLDFNVGSAVYTEIVNIELYFCPTDTRLFSFDYQENGIWKASSKPIVFKQEPWGGDERYKFVMTTVNSAGETVEEWWGTLNPTDSRPTKDTPPSYYYLAPSTSDRWSDKFKFASEMDGSLVDIILYFQAEGPYTHSVVKVGEIPEM